MHHGWLRVAIKICGSRGELARRIGVREAVITYWLNHGKEITLEYAIKIEKATQGIVSRLYLVPHLDKQSKNQIKAEMEAAKNQQPALTFKEKVMLGLTIEEALGSRQGLRPGQLLREKIPEVEPHSEDTFDLQGIFQGRTEAFAAKKAGFGNYKTYQQAKKVVRHGIPELVLMTDQNISISLAAKIAKHPAEKQYYLLSLSHHEMLDELNKAQAESETKKSTSCENNQRILAEKVHCPCCQQYKSLTNWMLLSSVGLFKNQNVRKKQDEEHQDCEVTSPQTTI
jgi:DNA-binding transcriptional regulator YdaS (Cro superfamily)